MSLCIRSPPSLTHLKKLSYIRLDRAPEDVVNHLPTRIWSGKGWEKESDWVKKLRRRAREAQASPESDKADQDPIVDLESQALDEPSSAGDSREHRAGSQSVGRTFPDASIAAHRLSVSGSDSYGSTDQDEVPGRHLPWFDGQSECVSSISISASFTNKLIVDVSCSGHLPLYI